MFLNLIPFIFYLFLFFSLIVNSKLFKLNFLENISLVRLYTSVRDCKGVENIHGSHFMKAFSALPSHSK